MIAKPVVVALCERSGITVKPWAEAGFECWCVDIAHSIRQVRQEGNIKYVWGDIRTWCPPSEIRNRIVFIAAMPPCTHVAVSGAQDFPTKGTGLLRDSLELFSACEHAACWAGVPYFIENPVGKFSDHMRKPDYYFHPWHYGDLWFKKTCLWTGNGFIMPPAKFASQPKNVKDKIFRMANTDDRSIERSKTPPNFAHAVFQYNYEQCLIIFNSLHTNQTKGDSLWRTQQHN